jgi:hypothetical protein
VGEQVIHRDLVAVIRQLGDVYGHRRRARVSLLDKEQDRRGDELLSYGSGVEDRVRADRNIALEVGRTVSTVYE